MCVQKNMKIYQGTSRCIEYLCKAHFKWVYVKEHSNKCVIFNMHFIDSGLLICISLNGTFRFLTLPGCSGPKLIGMRCGRAQHVNYRQVANSVNFIKLQLTRPTKSS